jgi:hypothetical protein
MTCDHGIALDDVCPRCADPLTVEDVLFPPSDTLPRRVWNLLVPVRLRATILALVWKVQGR